MTTAEATATAAEELSEPAADGAPARDTTDPQDEQAEPDTGRNAAKDAAKYRRQARDAEAERDTLRTRLETLQRHQIEGIAAEAGIQKPSAVWAAGASVSDCLDADGQVDTAKARAITQQAVQTLGLATARPPSLDAGPRTPPARARGWSDVLRPNR